MNDIDWLKDKWLTYLMLFVITPVGLLMMISDKDFSPFLRITAFVLLLAFIGMLFYYKPEFDNYLKAQKFTKMQEARRICEGLSR